jgi:hypothetical protein
MVTTAIVAEILVTGLLALVWLILAFLNITGLIRIDGTTVTQLKDWASLILVLVLGFAYPLGVIVDRAADWLVGPIDWRLRNNHFKYDDDDDVNLPKVSEARLRMLLDSKNEGLASFLNYVRSRLRLARSTCLNLILITLAAAILLGTRSSIGNMELHAVIAGGLVLFSLSLFAWVRLSRTYYKRLAQGYKLVTEQQYPDGGSQEGA